MSDLDGDERLDIALTPSEDFGEIAWYAAPIDPTSGPWPKHVLNAAADPFNARIRLTMGGVDGRPSGLRIYDVGGHLVRDLLAEVVLGDVATATWDGRDLRGRPAPAGVYFAILSVGRDQAMRKLVLVE